MVDPWAWQVRIFFSVDIVGSTPFKLGDKPPEKVPEWPQVFHMFFSEFPLVFHKEIDELSGKLKCPAKPRIWKFNGDEILFYADLNDHTHAPGLVIALKEAVKKYCQNHFQEKDLGLSLKATVWVAGFPITNTSITPQDHASTKNPLVDFIGPQIDLGFRLTQLADQRRMPISVELARILVDALKKRNARNECILCYEGRRELRGVRQGKSYPFLWVDIQDGACTKEESLLKVEHKKDIDAIHEFLEEYVKNSQTEPIFIAQDPDVKYSRIPPQWENIRTTMQRKTNADADRGYALTLKAKEPTEQQRIKLAPPKNKPTSSSEKIQRNSQKRRRKKTT